MAVKKTNKERNQVFIHMDRKKYELTLTLNVNYGLFSAHTMMDWHIGLL